jgi:transposase
MQLQLPLFPKEATMVSEFLGVYEKHGLVQYIVSGLPVDSHSTGDHNTFRYITSKFIEQGLCRKGEVERCFQVTPDSVTRWHKKYVSEGGDGFFGHDARQGKAHKIRGEKRQRIQSKLDKGQSVNSIAREEGLRESAIRYAVSVGHLKKTQVPK